jgi:hypothetical protein
MKRLLLALIFTVLLSAAVAGSASASTWTGRQLTGEAAKVTMFGASCPTVSLCVMVGGQNTVATSTNPTGPSADWNTAYIGEGARPTGSNEIFPGRQIRAVACPSSSLCIAVSFEGLIYTSTNPTGGVSAWSVTDLSGTGPSTHLYGISCPSPSFCAVSAGKGKIVTSTNPTGGVSAWSVTQLEQPFELRGISCASPSLCVAVGDDGGARPESIADGEIVSSTNPLGGAWQQVQMPGAQGSLYGVSCPAPNLCVTGNLLGNLVLSTNPTGAASAWTTTDGGGSVQITAADCLSVSHCVVVDNNGDVLTSTNPTGGPGDWTFKNVVPYPGVDETAANAMFGVSCPSISLCAVAGNDGQIFTSEDPFAESPVPVEKTGGKKKNKKRPRRPRTTIAARPPLGVEIHSGKVWVRFHFFARNHVQFRGFACKIDGRSVKRCHSPKGYRVGLGRHVFRVRAIDWTGLKGPPAVARFRVCHPTTLPNCMGDPSPALLGDTNAPALLQSLGRVSAPVTTGIGPNN